MRLLFDQGTPVPLRNHLPHHTVETAYERGWHDLKNGELLARAEAEGFDALVTTDQNIRSQQNLAGRRIGVLVLMTTSWPRIRGDVTRVAHAIDNLHAGGYEEIAFPKMRARLVKPSRRLPFRINFDHASSILETIKRTFACNSAETNDLLGAHLEQGAGGRGT